MKIKLQTHDELKAVAYVIYQLFGHSVERADMAAREEMTTAALHLRITSMLLGELRQKLARQIINSIAEKPALKMDGPTGLALLAAWYATDTTQLDGSPLCMAVMNHVADELGKAYAGPVVLQYFL